MDDGILLWTLAREICGTGTKYMIRDESSMPENAEPVIAVRRRVTLDVSTWASCLLPSATLAVYIV